MLECEGEIQAIAIADNILAIATEEGEIILRNLQTEMLY